MISLHGRMKDNVSEVTFHLCRYVQLVHTSTSVLIAVNNAHVYEKSFIEKCFFTLQRQCTLVYLTFFFL